MKITREEVLKIARMSRLTVREDEIDGFVEQLQQVLGYAERVAEVAATAQEPPIKNVNMFREDVVVKQESGTTLAQAPEREGDFFVVPAILEQS